MRVSFASLLLLVALAVSAPAESVPIFTVDGQVNPAVLQLPPGSTAQLDLPGGGTYELQVMPPFRHPSGNVTWRARLAGAGPGAVMLLTGDATSGLFGTIVTPKGSYRVVPGTGPWNAVRVTRETSVPYASAFDIVPVRPDKVRLPAAPSHSAEDHAQTTVINVMFRYTASARDDMQLSTWRAHLDNLIATVNEAYSQSGTDIVFTRVGEDFIELDETADNAAALGLVKVDLLDGATNIEDVRLSRDAHLVTLLREWQPSHGTCGAAHLPVCGDDGDCYDAALGYSAVSLRGSCTTLELAHQWGHNFGSAHEPADGQLGTYGYSHGHVTGGDVGTVMAVGGANRAAYFSAPGIAQCGGQACGVTDVSDNARSLERTRHFISRWITDRSIAFADPDPRLLRNETATLALDRFGVVGVTYDVDLIRNGAVVEALHRAEPFLEDEMSLTLSPTVQPGGGYVVQVRSSSRPEVSFDLPVTVDEPPPAAELAFTEANVQAPGNGGGVTLRVERGGSSDGEARVDYETLGGSAAGNFTPTSGTLVWADGDTAAKTFTVENVRSAQSGQVTTIFVVLRNPSDGARLGAPSQVEIRVAGQSGGGGGGSFGTGMIAVLAALWMLARRRRVPA